MPDEELIRQLKQWAVKCRIDILKMISAAKSGHPGGSLSSIDLVVALYFHALRWNPTDPSWADRDRFVLSKGHAIPAVYAVLAQKGVLAPEETASLRSMNSRLQGHPDRVRLPFVEASTGSLGKGLSMAQGMALGLKLSKKDARVYCLVGDGESQEGQIWEAALSAPKFRLDNLIVFLDCNNAQLDGRMEEIMNLHPIADKWRAFGWAVQEIDGHSYPEILGALSNAQQQTQAPSFIIARTVKGKGVSFMENVNKWHGVAPSPEETETAIAELRSQLEP